MPPFIPARISLYTASELIEFLKAGSITLQNINMLKRLDLFSVDDLMEFIVAEACTFDDMRRCGLNYKVQQQLGEKLQLVKIERSFWDNACRQNTASSYREYLQAFPSGHWKAEAEARAEGMAEEEVWQTALAGGSPSLYEHYLALYPAGAHRVEAESRLRELGEQRESLRRALIDDMRHNPLHYTPYIMQLLLKGGDVSGTAGQDDLPSRYLAMGCTLSYKELVDEQVIPPAITEKDILTPEFQVPQVNNFDNFPTDRTDIYFLGVPRSGKSSVLAGLFHTMTRKGNWLYVPNINEQGVDNSMQYFNGLVRAVSQKKPPVATALDTINYINIDVPRAAGSSGTAHLNFVEISGECFRAFSNSLSSDSREVWNRLGASRVLANSNDKVLFFLLDYNTILGRQEGIDAYDQEEALNSALIVLTNDGPDPRRPQKGCTLSKVKSVGVIITKADLMETDSPEERYAIARSYLEENFAAFMNNLKQFCSAFSINRSADYSPYVLTFSLGTFYPGNTLIFDDRNSRELADTIERLVPTQRRGWLF